MNAIQVLKNINTLLADEDTKSWRTADVCNELGIFDWWLDNLSRTKLKEMRHFVTTAISLGYDGYVCFKVGAKYCSHGMWAYKEDSTDGYSPEGGCLFHSFRTGDNFWSICWDDGKWLMDASGVAILDIYNIRDVMGEIATHKLSTTNKERR